MNTPTPKEVARRAHKIWEDQDCPSGRDTEIWLEAERQLTAESAEAHPDPAAQKDGPADRRPEAPVKFTERVKGEMASEIAVEHLISPPLPEDEAIKAALPKKSRPS